LTDRNKDTKRCDTGYWKHEQKQTPNEHVKTRHLRHSSRKCGIFGLFAVDLFPGHIHTRVNLLLKKVAFRKIQLLTRPSQKHGLIGTFLRPKTKICRPLKEGKRGTETQAQNPVVVLVHFAPKFGERGERAEHKLLLRLHHIPHRTSEVGGPVPAPLPLGGPGRPLLSGPRLGARQQPSPVPRPCSGRVSGGRLSPPAGFCG